MTNKRKIISICLEKKTKQAQNQAQAILQARLAKIMSQVKHVETIPDVTLQRLINDYLNNYKPRVRRSTYANCQGQLKNVQKWQFENVQLWQFKMALYD